MTTTVNVHEAKTNLSRLLNRAASGEDIIIARDGTPLARLVPIAGPPPRELGFVHVHIPESFFDPMPDDELDLWS
jgi:prevent-host-death family protein